MHDCIAQIEQLRKILERLDSFLERFAGEGTRRGEVLFFGSAPRLFELQYGGRAAI